MDKHATYAKELLAIRERLGWTQKQMAEFLGIIPNSYSRYEQGTRKVSEPIIRLARTAK